LQAASPATSAKEPATQGAGTLEPAGQAAPRAHGIVAAALPAAQVKPAAHGADGAARPAAAQTQPAVHGRHAVALAPPGAPLNVPGGQGMGATLPVPHQKPGGHRSPTTPAPSLAASGVGVDAPCRQKCDAAHGPVAVAAPAAAQNRPGGQASGAADPAGQTSPGLHSKPDTPSLGAGVFAPPKHA